MKLYEVSEDTNVLIEKYINSIRDNSTRNITISLDLVLAEEVKGFKNKFESMKVISKSNGPVRQIDSFDGLYSYLVNSTKKLSKDKNEILSALSNVENLSQAESRIQREIKIKTGDTCPTATKNFTRRVSESPEKELVKNTLRSNSDCMQEDPFPLKLTIPLPAGRRSDFLKVPSPGGISNSNDSANKSNGGGLNWPMRRFVFKRELKKKTDD